MLDHVRLATIGAVLFALVVGGASGRPQAPRAWRLVDLGFGNGSIASAVNASGQVVGTVRNHAFIWQDGKTTDLGPADHPPLLNDNGLVVLTSGGHVRTWKAGKTSTLPALGTTKSLALDVNDRGEIVGWSSNKARRPHACVWRSGRIIDLGTHGLANSQAVAINDRGVAVGWRKRRSMTPMSRTRSFAWLRGHERDLTGRGGSVPVAIDAAGDVVLKSRKDNPYSVRESLWRAGTLTDLGDLGGPEVTANAINDTGTVVGVADTTDRQVLHAFLWRDGHMIDLPAPRRAWWTEAVAVNNSGLTVGYSLTSNDAPNAAFDDYSTAIAWVEGILARLPERPHADQSSAAAVNDSGVIVGQSGGAAVIWMPR